MWITLTNYFDMVSVGIWGGCLFIFAGVNTITKGKSLNDYSTKSVNKKVVKHLFNSSKLGDTRVVFLCCSSIDLLLRIQHLLARKQQFLLWLLYLYQRNCHYSITSSR